MKAGFWRRLAAMWIDSFVIYAIAVFVIELTAAVHLRIALEPLYVVVGAVYGSMMLARWKQTIGKMLLGIAVTTKTGAEPTLRNVLLREALGKWGIAFAVPAALGRLLVGQGWVPTVYDLLILPPVLLVLFVHYLIAKRTWYDWLGGTVVERVPGLHGRAKPAVIALMAAAALGLGTKAAEFAVQGWLPCRLSLYRSMRSTTPYVAFLKQGQAKPIDYVIGLFDRYDVVVLCERLHPEASQWDFIMDLIRDPRFGDRVGHVFTEYGQVSTQSSLDSFMATDGLDSSEVQAYAARIMREMNGHWPTWTNTNVYTYLTRLYELNQSLPPEKRIHHHFTDMSFNWAEMTTQEKYQACMCSLEKRDEHMAQTVIAEMGRLAKSQSKPTKCLVVMNYRHAFDLTGRSPPAPMTSAADVDYGIFELFRPWDPSRRHNTYEYLRDAFGGRAANVLLGAYYVLNPIAGGVWDTAFAEAGDPLAGFDLADSPFGEDAFDICLLPAASRLKFRDVFTGYVNAQPLGQQYLQSGVPGYFKGFEEEALRRAGLVGEDYVRVVKSEIKQEMTGLVGVKSNLPHFVVESALELWLLALAGTGLLIGVISFGVGQWRHRSRRDV